MVQADLEIVEASYPSLLNHILNKSIWKIEGESDAVLLWSTDAASNIG